MKGKQTQVMREGKLCRWVKDLALWVEESLIQQALQKRRP